MREDDEEYLTRLLASLAETPPDPMSSIERAMVDGRARRRRRRNRHAVTGAVAVVAALALAVPVMLPRGGSAPAPAAIPSRTASPAPTMPAAPAVCQAHILSEPDGFKDSEVLAADPTGRYQVGYAGTAGHWTLVVWDHGQLAASLKMTGPRPTVAAINSAGVVVGSTVPQTTLSPPSTSAWVYRNGNLSYLPAIPGNTGLTWYTADGINAAGDIVGYAYGGGPKAAGESARLVVWPANASTTPRAVAPPAGTTFAAPAAPEAASIEDGGRVYATVAAPGAKPGMTNLEEYSWSPTGVATKLAVPDGFGKSWLTERAGRLLGDLDGAAGTTTYASLDLSSGQLARYPAPFTIAAVNRWGWSVGTEKKRLAVAVLDGHVLNLPVPIGGGDMQVNLSTISDSGEAIGGTLTVAGLAHAVLWTCQ
ncbi:MAG TPA: hypothetical protein VGJ07_24185 [Rugosimonospora sp.]